MSFSQGPGWWVEGGVGGGEKGGGGAREDWGVGEGGEGD
jgi:hypothetical protein